LYSYISDESEKCGFATAARNLCSSVSLIIDIIVLN